MDRRAEGADSARGTASDEEVRNAIVGFVKGGDVRLERAAAGFVAAKGNLSVTNGGCGPVVANGGVTIRYGGCGPMIANGDVSIEYGGTQGIIAAGDARVGSRAVVGMVVSPRVTVEEGGRVLLRMGSRQALAFGAAAGAAYAVFNRLLTGRRR